MIQRHIILSKVDEIYLYNVETEIANRVNVVWKIVLEVEMEGEMIWTYLKEMNTSSLLTIMVEPH